MQCRNCAYELLNTFTFFIASKEFGSRFCLHMHFLVCNSVSEQKLAVSSTWDIGTSSHFKDMVVSWKNMECTPLFQ